MNFHTKGRESFSDFSYKTMKKNWLCWTRVAGSYTFWFPIKTIKLRVGVRVLNYIFGRLSCEVGVGVHEWD